MKPFVSVPLDKVPSSWFIHGIENCTGAFSNNRYIVIRYELQISPSEWITWLSVRRVDRKEIFHWKDMQQIKSFFAGPEREGMQMFPAESRLAEDERFFNTYDIWVLPEGGTWPWGYMERVATKEGSDNEEQTNPIPEERP